MVPRPANDPVESSGKRRRGGTSQGVPSQSRDAHEKVAALLHSIARNHALVDGNKRLAWAAARVFCLLNGRDIEFEINDAEALVIGAADGSLDVAALARLVAGALRSEA